MRPETHRFAQLALVVFILAALCSQAQAATPQTISFPAMADRRVDDGPFAPVVTASSGLPVTLEIVSPGGVATVGGGTITLTGVAGSVTVKASQAGNGSYDAAADVYGTFVVSARFVRIASGPSSNHSAGIKTDGSLWTWGYNGNGQLGNGTAVTARRSYPAPVGPANAVWVDVSCGENHSHAIRSDGTLWGWGSGWYGQLGTGALGSSLTPVQIGTATTWTALAAGSNHTLALRSDGTLWAWGNNSGGQLGDGTRTNRLAPVQIGTATNWKSIAGGAWHSMALQTDGTLWTWGYNERGQVAAVTTYTTAPAQPEPTITNWTAIACGVSHSVGLRTDGTLWAWGANGSGQLGNGSGGDRYAITRVGSASTWAKIAAGGNRTTALRSDGSLWAWGANESGQLGDGTWISPNLPVQIGTIKTWHSLSCGAYHTLALRTDGSFWAWGSNVNGQLGNGTDRSLPGLVQPGSTWTQVATSSHTAAVRADGTLWAWGYNGNGQLGLGTTTIRHQPVQVGAVTTWKTVACGGLHTAALRTDGSLWTWGHNDYGQLGSGTTTSRSSPARVGTLTTWSSVSSGQYHTAALRADGTLWTWGHNNSGQLGDGTFTNRTSPTQVGTATNWTAVSCGGSNTLGLRSDGTLWSWGANNWGQIGDATTNTRSSPVQVGTGTTWTAIACGGSSFNMGLQADGTLWTWGSNYSGQLGLPGENGYPAPTQKSTPTQVGTGSSWAAISGGNSHGVATRTDGTVWAWGDNTYDQLGDVAEGPTHVPLQSGPLTTWASVSAGASHTAALKNDGTLWTWGRQEVGNLGSEDSSVPLSVPPAPAAQTLDFPAFPEPAVGQSVPLAATASSGLPATFTVTGPATLEGDVMTPTGAGSVVVSAHQPGTAAWLPAESRMQTFVYAPVISLSGNFQPISSGSTTPATANHTDFGSYTEGPATSRAFTLTNSGNAAFLLSAATLGGPHAADFSFTTGPAASVPPGGSTTFHIAFAPGASSLRQATVSLAGNAPAYTFAIQGTDAASQLITFPPLTHHLTTEPPLTLAATTSSGLPIHYKVVSAGGVATISGNVLTFTGTSGAVTVRASQSGDATRHAAEDVYRTFLVASPSQLFTKISSAAFHNAAIARDGTLWTWGANFEGQLGDGTTTYQNRPVQVGSDNHWTDVACGFGQTTALRDDGTLWTWGANDDGQLGDGTRNDRIIPGQIGSGHVWTAIASGGRHSLARRADGTLWAWGDNSYAQLGDGTFTDGLSPQQIGTANNWTAFACHDDHSLALRSDGTLWGWGRSSSGGGGGGGVIIIGAPSPGGGGSNTPVAGTSTTPIQIGTDTNWVAVACGSDHSAALRADGTLWAWNGSPQFAPSIVPAQIGTATTWSSISNGALHTLIRRGDGTLWAFGHNTHGQVGNGTSGNTHSAPMQVGTEATWNAVAGGTFHSLGLKNDGSLWTWGDNEDGQLGNGVFAPALPPVAPNATVPACISPYPSAQVLTFPPLPATVSIDQAVPLAASASSGLPVSYTVTGPATLIGNVLTPTGFGSVTITASQPVNDAWLPATPVTHTLQVQATPRQSWRQTHFGTVTNAGAAADTADFDKDGLPNLLEFAFGLNPTSGASQLPQPQLDTAAQTFTYTFTEPPEAAGTGLIYSARASTALGSGVWTPVPDTGSGTTHVFTVSTSGQESVFIQLEVTAP